MDAHIAQSSSRPLYILGPCSVENSTPNVRYSAWIKTTCPISFLAPWWTLETRTRPGAFEGLGQEGIHYLTEAAKDIGADPITEVARASHVEACLQAGFSPPLDWRTHDGKSFFN